jgi:ATP-dependent Clp protease adaptor protein ClpS
LPNLSPSLEGNPVAAAVPSRGRPLFFSGQDELTVLRRVAALPYFRVTMIDQVILMTGDEPGQGDGLDEIETGVVTRTRPRTKKPSNYKVLMLNDDYTPMEFVVLVLQRYFTMDLEDATRVMLQVHQQGVAVCGVFTYEVAETKVAQVIDFARENQHPLQCTLEKA